MKRNPAVVAFLAVCLLASFQAQAIEIDYRNGDVPMAADGVRGVDICGDNIVGSTEECDDGGLQNGDGCSSVCEVEGGWTCDASSPSVCTDIDECTAGTDNCDEHAACANTQGGHTCTCNEGWEGNGYTCTDIDECQNDLAGCDENASCVNTAGSFFCSCYFGFNGDGYTCTDIDECTAGTDNCDEHAACANTQGGHTCACNEGWEGDGVTCTDINECLTDNGGCDENASCVNTAGSFFCSCYFGFNGDGYTCTDIDECEAGTDNCDEHAACANTQGGHTCACNEGWEGDGVTCTDINECLTDNGGCDPLSLCTNAVGSRTCGPCPAGYDGTGETACTDIDECEAGTDNCDDNASCTNTPGGHTCACNEGWEGDGVSCVFNECYNQEDWTACGDETPESACFSEHCDELAENDRCIDAIALNADEPVGRDGLFGFHAFQAVNPPCSDPALSGPDAFFRFAPQQGASYTLLVEPSENLDIAVVLWEGCGEDDACVLALDDGSEGAVEEIAGLSTLDGVEIVIQVIDIGGTPGEDGESYTITVTKDGDTDGDAEVEADGDMEDDTDGDAEVEADDDMEDDTDGDAEVEADGDMEDEADGDAIEDEIEQDVSDGDLDGAEDDEVASDGDWDEMEMDDTVTDGDRADADEAVSDGDTDDVEGTDRIDDGNTEDGSGGGGCGACNASLWFTSLLGLGLLFVVRRRRMLD